MTIYKDEIERVKDQFNDHDRLRELIKVLEDHAVDRPEPLRYCPECGSTGMCHFTCNNY